MLIYYQVSGEPGIRRARYRWLQLSIGYLPWGGGGVDFCTFIDHHHVSVFSRVKFSQLVSTTKLLLPCSITKNDFNKTTGNIQDSHISDLTIKKAVS